MLVSGFRLVVIWVLVALTSGQVLTPPYFNLAEGRRITATATCGEGVEEPELYCKLVGANSDKPSHFNVIQGQLCDFCDPGNRLKKHPPEFAIDGSERWWQSPPLSRGMDYNAVNLTIDLGQLFQVAYVVIKMANSPRPGIWVLERSVDNGNTYTPWQYFADNEGDCERFFGEETLKSIREDDDVICTTRFSKVVPLEGGEIFVSLLNERPSAKNFFNSTTLQEFTRATNVRLRLIRTKTLLGHLMSVARQDPTVTRRYFYSIKDISIGGRCVCNGHASVCDITDPDDKYQLQCRCEHNTCGSECEECCPGFIQKKWRPASNIENFVCEPCNCFGHTNECVYDENVDRERLSLDIHMSYSGGGVCQNCRHHTEGINCDRCVFGYYRPNGKLRNDTDACQPCQCPGHIYTGDCFDGEGRCECRMEFLPPFCDACNDGYYDYPNCKPCDCHKDGTIGGVCEVGGGQCPCKENYISLTCSQCASGYFNFSECQPCECVSQGSLSNVCDSETGQCRCQNNYGGLKCGRCEHGYFDYANGCEFCNCDARGTVEEICDKQTGQCLCKEGYSGERCDNSAPGFWGYPLVQFCGCHERGSSSTVCDASGKCACLNGYAGRACDQCSPGYYNFPECEPCNCDQAGSVGISCNSEGRCQCKYNFDGIHCDKCRENFYNFPLCEECNCHPAGVLPTFAGCGNAPVGELCECKERVTGRICNKCKFTFWNLQQSNILGCEECGCHAPGTVGALTTCDMDNGQCACKPSVISRRCDQCEDGTFSLMEGNLFGCKDCQCNIGGSNNNVCNKVTGQCSCRHRIQGQRCDEPMQTHYFPTLYQHKYEVEDGRTPQNTPVRFGYDESIFPGYSWRGYAVYSELQKETIHDIYISKQSLYRLIFYYMNPSNQVIKGKVVIKPENPLDDLQEVDVHFQPTNEPQLMTVSTANGFPLPFLMNPGSWVLSIQNKQSLFLDYMVLLPLAYYEATILTERATSPSHIGSEHLNGASLHYAYPDVHGYDTIYGSAGFLDLNGTRSSVELYENYDVLSELEAPPMAWLGANSDRIKYDMRLRRPGKHVLLINYYTPEGAKATSVAVTTVTQSGRQKGRAVLYDCTYTWVCRQVVADLDGNVAVFDFDSNFVTIIISIRGDTGQDVTLHSLTAIPEEEWNMDLVEPNVVCTRLGGECLDSSYPNPTETTKVEFEANLEGKSADFLPRGVSNSTVLVYLNASDPMVDITGKLRHAGRYLFVVHYFQPNHPRFDMDVLIQNGQFYEGVLPLRHCPNVHGCRSVIRHLDNAATVFDILENFVLSLKQKNGYGVWLDYVLAVPEQSFTPEVLQELPKDKTAEFIDNCGENHFDIDPQDTGFCREAAFALTADYNNGALACHCNFKGSVSFECQVFGGQCPCKPNVIGRECNQCKTGYFGFPNCRPCDCPSTALCDPLTGECICPPRVVGERCERCALHTYGFDPIIGCEECRCNEIGVMNGELQCNLLTGQCQCKDNVVSRRCERCAAGYWSFPFCQLCNCDLRGTEAEICSQSDATCFCKAHTEGPSCDLCVPGTYNLEETNPDGCTKCFCFGKSQSCSQSNLFWSKMPLSQGWKSVTLELSEMKVTPKTTYVFPEEYTNLILMNLTSFYEPTETGYVYLAVPEGYLGNRIKSYGGFMTYNLLTITDEHGSDLSGEGDIVLYGSNITALYFHDRLEHGAMNSIRVELLERNFRTLDGISLRREEFMTMLHYLEGIYIRIHYGSYSTEARLTAFEIDTATEGYQSNSLLAASVEKCQCPPNYSGSSCEECSPGYYRTPAGPFGGFCIPCRCNNHADTCDPLTGECINCRDNTIGFNCEKCAAGYFGDALKGTPYDCLICSCPLPSKTNNFAKRCELTQNDDILCDCKEGYVGRRCDVCAPGYYGQPNVIGNYCKECECNDNIDVTSSYACDDISGICLSCLNNTYGEHCERCAPGFFGDAILLKNCQSCSCDECGTRECQHYTGVCECHENVIGDKCDRCAPDYWGFASCQGCHPCNCNEASESRQCDEETGQCRCRPGVTGQRCDRCKPGYWSYSEYGCTECTCRAGFSIGVGCDPKTGQCSCLPGVIGDNCEGCPERWVLIEGVGCRECDDCVHALLDTTDALSARIFPVIQEYESAAQSFFLHQRLQVINDSLDDLRANVDVFDLSSEELKPIQETIDNLYSEAVLLSTKGKLLSGRAAGSASEGLAVQEQAREVIDSIYDGTDQARDVIAEINSLVIGLETGTGAKIELAIREAEKVVNDMKAIDFSDKNDQARLDYEVAQEFFERIQNLSSSGIENQKRVDEAAARLEDLKSKIDDIEIKILDSNEEVYSISVMNRQSRTYGLENLMRKYKEIGSLGKLTTEHLDDADNYTSLAKMKLQDAADDYYKIDSELELLQSANVRLNDSVINIYDQLDTIEPIYEALDHSAKLKNTAVELDRLLSDTRQVTENALKAANAYDNIVSATDDALEAALEARNASDMAVDLSSGVSEDARASVEASDNKYRSASFKMSQVERDLIPQLSQAQRDVMQLEGDIDRIITQSEDSNRRLDYLQSSSLKDDSRRLQMEAETVNEEANKTDLRVATQYKNLQLNAKVARTLSKNIENAKRDTKLAHKQVERVQEILPGAQQITRDLLNKKGKIQDELQDVGDRLERLRRTITKTREKTNKIKVGIDFEQGSVIELKNPEDISDAATATEISVFIRTSDRTGLPLFFGTPIGGSTQLPRANTDDFMAIEIDEGYVRLTTALGEEPHSIVNSAYVADDQWHRIHVKRVGKTVRLSVYSEGEDVVTVEKVLSGTYSVLNLGPKVSKLYVGGIPAGVEVHPSLMSTYYTGQMEDLWINKRPIGLWNFVNRGSTDFPLKGAKERLVLKESKATSHELRFDGSGYVTVDTKGHETSPELSAVISFKTFAEDGLIYLLKNGHDEFVSIEIRGGRILYQHKLEAGAVTLISDGIYNDNNWHTIEATRVRGAAVIKVDSADFKQTRSRQSGRDFTNIPDVMYLGGYPGEHGLKEVSNEDFRGCIKDVRITEVTVDFSRSKESIGTVPGCVEEPVSLVSFHRQNPGYVKLGSPEGSGLDLVLKFKTDTPNGLLFYTETTNRQIYLSLSLSEGSLILRSVPGGEVKAGTYTNYMDSEWHIVTATRENNELRIDVDDFDKLSLDVVQQSHPFDGPVFFGGVPEYMSISVTAAAADDNFIGCIGDVTLNGKIIDFSVASKVDRPGVMLETCSLDKEITFFTYAPDHSPRPVYPIDVRPVTQRPPSWEVTDQIEQELDTESPDYFTAPPEAATERSTTLETTPPPMDTCALPVVPEDDLDVTSENGLRFGSKRDSRIEYNELPGSMRNDFMFSVEFRTEANEGVIFYAASISHRDFVTIYMKDGRIVFSFSTGTSPVIMRSTAQYNDNTWHKLVALRTGDNGRLELDGYIVSRGTVSGNAKHIDQQAPYYFGGLTNDIIELASDNTEQIFLSFNGCLRGFRMNNEIMGGKRRVIAVGTCSYKVEPGVFFGKGKLSHAVARLKFQVGLKFEMYLEVKPRKNSGVIMSVHGRRDFILLQLNEGVVELKVDNGKGIINAKMNMANPYQICDGQWHSIQILKNKHVIVLTVDGISSIPATGPLGSSSADTNKPMFLGSQPRLKQRRGNAVTEKYVGCMRNVSINRENLELSYILFVGEVNAGVCPLI